MGGEWSGRDDPRDPADGAVRRGSFEACARVCHGGESVRLLIVGATGQLGSDLLATAAPDIDVTGLTRSDLDVTDARAVESLLGRREFDVLINCTAFNDTAGAESSPGAAFEVNARAPETLAEAARKAGARFVHVSTDYVFDGETARPYVETDPPAPLGVYGASKLTGEALARRAHPEGTLVVRTAALFGVAGVGRGGNFVETILRAAGERVNGEGSPLRVVDDIVVSPTATADLARGILALLSAGAPAGLYHLVNEGQASWFEFARAIVQASGMNVEVQPTPASTYPSPFRRPAFSALHSGKAATIAGALPAWEEGLARYLDARRSQRTEPG